MLTSLDCLAKADEMAARALTCVKQMDREGYADIALGWRRVAAIAGEQERYEAIVRRLDLRAWVGA
jgi:hypothetical protein